MYFIYPSRKGGGNGVLESSQSRVYKSPARARFQKDLAFLVARPLPVDTPQAPLALRFLLPRSAARIEPKLNQ
jgi:hypothetical protein